jgi:hypothetical protein
LANLQQIAVHQKISAGRQNSAQVQAKAG